RKKPGLLPCFLPSQCPSQRHSRTVKATLEPIPRYEAESRSEPCSPPLPCFCGVCPSGPSALGNGRKDYHGRALAGKPSRGTASGAQRLGLSRLARGDGRVRARERGRLRRDD